VYEFALDGTLGTLILGIWRETLEQVMYFCGNLLTAEGLVRIGSWGIAQTSRNLSQPKMCFFDVVGQCAIFVECTPDLLGELLEIGGLWIHSDQLGQSLVDGFQLLVTCQTTPRKGFARAAVDRIPDGHAELFFNLVAFGILS
jgi:hypothetical protein